MYILLALIAACSVGVVLHLMLPGRDRRGAAVTPAVASATTAAWYTIMQWSGAAEADAWLWAVSLGTGALLAAAATVLLSGRRTRDDARERQRLGI